MSSASSTSASANGTIVKKTIVRSGGLQIRPPPKRTAEQEKELREQLHIEIANKTKACSNIAYECSLPRIDSYEYCIRHILQDPQAPYKQCAYLLSNGKRCLQPAPKYDPRKDVYTNYCFEHSRLSQLIKTRASVGKYKSVETNETILNELSHHINLNKTQVAPNHSTINNINIRSPYDAADGEANAPTGVKPVFDPFYDIDASIRNSNSRKILDYASDSSSSDVDVSTVTNTWKGQDLENSDNESIDSQNEDLLKHAEVYTTEQVTKITKEKLMRLRTLYIDQLYRLKHVLREKRRNYVHSLRTERETLCTIHSQSKDTVRERRLYEKLKALNKYHNRNGKEAILYKKFTEKRQRSKDGVLQGPPKTTFHNRCIYTEGGVKCGERIIPCSKYCRKHILEDKKQVLFRPCNIEKGGVVCQEPVPDIFEEATCVLHIQLPPQRNYMLKKYDSDTDDESGAPSPAASSLKKEDSVPIKEETPVETVKEEKTDEKLVSEDVEMQSVEDIGNNVTICHDADATAKAEKEVDADRGSDAVAVTEVNVKGATKSDATQSATVTDATEAKLPAGLSTEASSRATEVAAVPMDVDAEEENAPSAQSDSNPAISHDPVSASRGGQSPASKSESIPESKSIAAPSHNSQVNSSSGQTTDAVTTTPNTNCESSQ